MENRDREEAHGESWTASDNKIKRYLEKHVQQAREIIDAEVPKLEAF